MTNHPTRAEGGEGLNEDRSVGTQVERVMRMAGYWADAVLSNDDDPCTESGLACAQTHDALRLQIENELLAARVYALKEAVGAWEYQGARSVYVKAQDLIDEYLTQLYEQQEAP